MNIAIDLGLQKGAAASLFIHHVEASVSLLAKQHPEHTFQLYNGSGASMNAIPHLTTATRTRSHSSWMSAFIPKNKLAPGTLLIEIFQPGMSITRGASVILADLSPVVHPPLFEKKQVARFRNRIRKIVQLGAPLLVPSKLYKRILVEEFSAAQEQIHLLPLPSNTVGEYSWEEKENIKAEFTDGKEFFLFAGDIHPRYDLITLLKAFSHFKKWQRSNMQLVIAAYPVDDSGFTAEQLDRYKYKTDVILLDSPADTTIRRLAGAAYAFLYPALYDPFPALPMQAISLKVPVICNDIAEIRELAADGPVYTGIDEMALFQMMQRIFKDEGWRKEQVERASAQYAIHSGPADFNQPFLPLSELIAK